MQIIKDGPWKTPLFLIAAFVGLVILVKALGFTLAQIPEPIGPRADYFVDGSVMTIKLTIVSAIFGLAVGVLLALINMAKNPIINKIGGFFIWILRGTPLLVQIMFAYFALPAILPEWMTLNEFSAAVLALGLNVGAYNAEVIRAGIEAIPKGQWEASWALGLSKIQNMRLVVLPQALKVVVPPLINNLIALLKDSSLASTISLLELSLVGQRVSSETFEPVPVLTTIALIYLLMTTYMTFLTRFLGLDSKDKNSR